MSVSGWSTNVTNWISDQANIIYNNNMVPVEKMLIGAAYLIGLAFVLKAIYSLKAYGEARTMMSSNTNIKEPITYLFVGAVFIYFPTAFKVFLYSTFGYTNVLAYAPVSSNNQQLDALFGPDSLVGPPLALIIQIIGLIAFIRGWVLIARTASSGQPPGGTGKGFVHVIGGIMAMNIVGTLQIINNTLYGT
jgi:intracellular multiplication protein IcmC